MANPFAAAAASNPFAAATTPAANPFAAAAAPAAANPFATAPTPATSNPFATAAAPAANPFATAAAPAAANPFATAAAPAAANPFAAAATSNPFATAAAPAANPFAAAAAAAAANPFATAAAPTAATVAAAGGLHVSEQLMNDFKALREAYVPNLTTNAALENYSRFKYIVYNLQDPHVDRYVKPPELSQRQWEQALKEAPEPYAALAGDVDGEAESDDRKRARAADRLVPVAVLGFKGLQQRYQQQDQDIALFKGLATTLAASVKQVERDALAAETKIENLRQHHSKLSHRLIQVMEKVDRVLARGKPLDRNEVQLRNQLELLVERLNRPTEFKARLNELMSREQLQDGSRASRREQFAEDDLRQILLRLEAQRVGLSHLNDIVKKDARDLAIMARPHKALDVATARRGSALALTDGR